MKIAVQGLGKMGMQISRKLAEGGHTVYGMDLNASALQEATDYGVTVVETKEKLIEAFNGEQVVIWIMLAAQIVDAQVEQWLSLVPTGSILVDGGNSDFRSTKALNDKVNSSGSMLIDVDSADAFTALEPGLRTLAAPEGAYHHFGASGSGHYVKMVHNGVEYGMMQSLAEGYRMLKEGPYPTLDLAAAGEVWQHHSVITSWLNELTRSALQENPDLTGIDGVVAESGEARWY
jgi:6-phosphogluconate dehydrogenase